ncbi:hypothetical protein C0Q70_02076 [Pomacea canaliculata]|uniref:G-protein coupled receptors family 1 profile domain-containing protein n=1 Tax=Pomacea canaliculata TaxID=400727 RepID=A0A2T7Q193_POMCA|nr:hypothetical protein C0Q70_02076 [Pomacea canaliculata]
MFLQMMNDNSLKAILRHAHVLMDDGIMMDGFDQIQILLPKAHGLLYNSSSLNDSSLDSTDTRGNVVHNTLIILAYSILSAISLFGNTLHILVEWPLGNTLCHLVTFSLMLSNYVSTFTLTAIALDRHRVVLKPLSPRMSKTMAAGILVVIWVIAILLSLPYGIYFSHRGDSPLPGSVPASQRSVPHVPHRHHRHSAVLRSLDSNRGGLRSNRAEPVVSHPRGRRHSQSADVSGRAKRKSIKLLIAVVVVFTLCWLPLILYHLLTTLHPNTEVFSYNINVYFACHWFAISSTCFNPFVYCWMNENFREEVKSRFRCCFRHPLKYLPGVKRAGLGSAGPRRQRQDTSITRSSVRSSANMHSVRRDVTLLSEQEDMMSHKQSDGFMVAESAERDEEVQDLLSMYGNGRVEYHISSAHNCIKGFTK